MSRVETRQFASGPMSVLPSIHGHHPSPSPASRFVPYVRFLFCLFRLPSAKRSEPNPESERPCSQTFSPGRPAAARGRGSVGLAALRRWAARGAAGCMAARAAARRAAIAMPGSTVCTLPGSGRSPAMSARRAPRPWLGCCRGPGLRRKKQINAQTTLCTRKFRQGPAPMSPLLRQGNHSCCFRGARAPR